MCFKILNKNHVSAHMKILGLFQKPNCLFGFAHPQTKILGSPLRREERILYFLFMINHLLSLMNINSFEVDDLYFSLYHLFNLHTLLLLRRDKGWCEKNTSPGIRSWTFIYAND